MKHRFIVYLLLVFSLLLMIYIVYERDVNEFLKKKEVLSHTSIFNVPEVYISCYKDLGFSKSAYSNSCIKEIDKFTSKKETWDKTISQKSDVTCKDFKSNRDAFEFYSYMSGEFIKYLIIEKSSPREYAVTEPSCSYDPYNLNSDNDCSPCEGLR